MSGWVKIHRQIKDNAFCYGNSERLGFWVQLLLMANREKKEFYIGRQKVVCEAGEFATGREKLSESTGLHPSKVQRHLDILEKEKMIEQQMNSQFRIIKIKKWKDYQVTEQRLNNDRTTVEHQLNTNKNEENKKNEKNPLRGVWGEMKVWLKKQDSITNASGWIASLIKESDEKSSQRAWSDLKAGRIGSTPNELWSRAVTISESR